MEKKHPTIDNPSAGSAAISQNPDAAGGENRRISSLTDDTRRLLSWYDENRRDLPWRKDPTPYHVWLSEIMLQQTRAAVVKEYYTRFLAALPDIPALASAAEDTCAKLWQGLGYYSRVRNLQKAARIITLEYGGEMPGTPEELKKLPGIGDYTAAAVASIAFGYPAPAIDGNLLRVFARKTCLPDNIKSKEAKAAALTYYEAAIPRDRPGDYNQALMDLGASVCLPNGKPDCSACPWQNTCRAHETGTETDFPVMPPKAPRRRTRKTVFLITDGERILLRRRPKSGLLAGLFELPNADDLPAAEDAAYTAVLALLNGQKNTGIPGRSHRSGSVLPEPPAPAAALLMPLGPAKHIFTHREWDMTGWAVGADLRKFPLRCTRSGELFAASLPEIRSEYSIPSAFRAYMERLPEAMAAARSLKLPSANDSGESGLLRR